MSEEIKAFLNDKVYVLVYRDNYDRASEANQKLIDYIKYLQQENQRLYNLNNAIFRELLNKKYENKKQKEVINKAIEYINKCTRDENDDMDMDIITNLDADEVEELLDILKEVSE